MTDLIDEREWLAERFDEYRPHLKAVAYRMLGSLSEADDAVQDAWLRLSRRLAELRPKAPGPIFAYDIPMQKSGAETVHNTTNRGQPLG